MARRAHITVEYGNVDRTFADEDRLGYVDELNTEMYERLKGYSTTVMEILGGITLASASIFFIMGALLVMNQPSLLPGPLLFQWNIPYIDYIESLYSWAGDFVLLFSALILVRGCFYAMYKSHGRGLWFATLGMLAVPFLFILVMGVYTNDPTCITLMRNLLGMLDLSRMHTSMVAYGLELRSLLAALVVSYFAFLGVYLHYIKKYGPLPAPTYGRRVKAERPVLNFNFDAFTVWGSAFMTYAVLGLLSLISLARYGMTGLYNTNTLGELWITYPFAAMWQHFGSAGVFIAVLLVFAFLSLLPFADRNFFTSWKRRKGVVAIGVIMMIAYAALGFTAMPPNQVANGLGVAIGLAAPAFNAEFPVIALSIVLSALVGGALLFVKGNGGMISEMKGDWLFGY